MVSCLFYLFFLEGGGDDATVSFNSLMITYESAEKEASLLVTASDSTHWNHEIPHGVLWQNGPHTNGPHTSPWPLGAAWYVDFNMFSRGSMDDGPKHGFQWQRRQQTTTLSPQHPWSQPSACPQVAAETTDTKVVSGRPAWTSGIAWTMDISLSFNVSTGHGHPYGLW